VTGVASEGRSRAELLAEMSPEDRATFIGQLTPDEALAMIYDWHVWARPTQLRPIPKPGEPDWYIWMLLGGRGMGKTKTGAETIREWAEESQHTEPYRFAIIGQTAADVRDVMLQGESGILSISPPWFMPVYEPSRRRVTWPNGTFGILFSGDSPDQLRGPQFHKAWVDELAKYLYPQETWDNLEFGLRLGDNPQALVTTTPRPIPIIKSMLEDEQVFVTRGSSYENISNLAPSFIRRVIRKYEGTRVGRQELHAEVLSDMPGALWSYEMIERNRVQRIPDMVRIVIAVDPAVSVSEDSDETGIVVCGLGTDGLGYVMRDLSGRYSAEGWAQKVVDAYYDYSADRVIAEVNNGGDLVESVIRSKDSRVSYKAVHASRGKIRRAEPISAFYERGQIRHHGQFAAMEDQMTTYNPTEAVTPTERRRTKMLSPDRMDAMVWGMTELLGKEQDDGSPWGVVKR
jgi:phage terminase large subunit-like protein